MVDSTKSLGTVLGFQAAERPQVQKNDRNEKPQAPSARDEVRLSREALDLAQAEESARTVRRELENSDVSLGFDQSKFDETV